MIRVWIAALLLAAGILGCARDRGEPAVQQPKQEAPPPAAAEEKPRQTITMEKARPAQPAASAARRATDAPPLLAAGRSGRLMPLDFRIGILQDSLQASRLDMTVTRTVERFLADLAQARVNPEFLYPPLREELSRSFAYYVERQLLPESYRIGRVGMEQEPDARVSVRLFRGEAGAEAAGAAAGDMAGASDMASAEGEIYLSAWEGSWYIADIQIGLELLAEPQPKRMEKFLPYGQEWGPYSF